MKKNTVLYCTVVLATISLVCAAALGLGNKFLYTPPDTAGALGVIFNALTGTKDYQTIFDADTPDTFTVNGQSVTITKEARAAANVEAAYRIENKDRDGGDIIYLLIVSVGNGRNGDVRAVTAYIADESGLPENDTIAGMRPFTWPAAEYTNANNQDFAGGFADRTAGDRIRITDTTGYTGATETARGFIEAVNNASAFYKAYRDGIL